MHLFLIKGTGGAMKFEEKRKQMGIRIPAELDRRLENHVSKIGISKQAFILNLIFNALEHNEKKPNNSAD